MCIAYQSCAQAPSVAILRQKKVDQNIVGKRLNFCFTEMRRPTRSDKV